MRRQGHRWAVALLLAAATAQAAFDAAAFRSRKDLAANASPHGLVAVPLDAEIHAATRDGYPDLRLVTGDGQEVPFLVEQDVVRRQVARRNSFAAKVVSLEELPDNRLRIVIERPDRSPAATGIALRTSLRDFERTVAVAGSDDGQDWTPLVEAALIYDYSRFMDLRNVEIALPANDWHRFSLVVETVVDEGVSPYREFVRTTRAGTETETAEWSATLMRPLRIDAVSFWNTSEHEEIAEARTAHHRLAETPVMQEDAKTRETLVEFAGGRIPLNALTLATASRNFRREVVVESEAMGPRGPSWVRIAGGTVSQVAFGDFRESRLEIAIPETRATRYRLRLVNGDSPALQVDGVNGRGPVYRLLFLMPEGEAGNLRLLYGSETTPKPKYDLAAVLAMPSRRTEPTTGIFGPEVPNPLADAAADRRALAFLASPWFLGVAVAVMVAVLAGLVVHAAAKVKALPEEGEG